MEEAGELEDMLLDIILLNLPAVLEVTPEAGTVMKQKFIGGGIHIALPEEVREYKLREDMADLADIPAERALGDPEVQDLQDRVEMEQKDLLLIYSILVEGEGEEVILAEEEGLILLAAAADQGMSRE